jgi:predicted RNase H-like HicB family nuclease
MKKVNLDYILEQALEQALTSLTGKAAAMVEQALEQALLARVQALLEDGGLTPAIEAPEAPARAKVKVAMVEATPTLAQEEANPTPAKAPRRRAKARATLTPEDNLEFILGAAQAALEKYRGITTPKGKGLPEVLGRRLRNVLKHAQTLGRGDLQALAQRALALIDVDPRGVAMASWQALAGRLGLPVPAAQGGEE